jgi:hypothetical protein
LSTPFDEELVLSSPLGEMRNDFTRSHLPTSGFCGTGSRGETDPGFRHGHP